MVKVVNRVNERSTQVDPVDLKSTLSTKVDQGAKGRFIQKASEEGLTPSEALRRLVDVHLEGGLADSSSSDLDKLTAFVHDVGRYRMEDCRHAKEGEKTGKLICWLWRFREEDKSSMEKLEMVPIIDSEYSHAEADPIMCGACHNYETEE